MWKHVFGLSTFHFYPRPLRGGRPAQRRRMERARKFLSTPSARRATGPDHPAHAGAGHFYPRPLRGGRRHGLKRSESYQLISIHALCEEGDPNSRIRWTIWTIFLSTPSARRATVFKMIDTTKAVISIHALCEEGDPARNLSAPRPRISIHALCEEGDVAIPATSSFKSTFLSTPSARRATVQRDLIFCRVCISIHALREEGDLPGLKDLFWPFTFLSTPSARRATCRRSLSGCRPRHFYPRPPRGGRPPARSRCPGTKHISIHALREEGDLSSRHCGTWQCHFYPRPPRGGRLGPWFPQTGDRLFLSTPSARRATAYQRIV